MADDNYRYSKLDKLKWNGITNYSERVITTFKLDLPRDITEPILDLGCSLGKTTEELKKLFSNSLVIGLEYKSSLLRELRFRLKRGIKKTCGEKYVWGDGYFPPFREQSFGAVFCMNNLGFVVDILGECEDRKKVLSFAKDIGDLVKDDGYLLISTFDAYRVLRRKGKIFKIEAKSNLDVPDFEEAFDLITESCNL